MATIDCCTREIVGWELSPRCRAQEAIAVIERALAEQGITAGMLTLGTDNGSAFTAREAHDLPSKAHRHSYARRTAVERTFSRLHDPASTEISRGWSRIMGLTGNAIMLACAAIIANIATADAFTARQAEDRRRVEHGLPPRRRRRRRRRRGEGLHELAANANAPLAT